MSLTNEQASVIHCRSDNIAVQAYAGTGKTFTLTKFAEQNRNHSIVYIAYNRSIADEAKRKFPKNVECITSHSLAYKQFGVDLKEKLEGDFSTRSIKIALKNRDNPTGNLQA